MIMYFKFHSHHVRGSFMRATVTCLTDSTALTYERLVELSGGGKLVAYVPIVLSVRLEPAIVPVGNKEDHWRVTRKRESGIYLGVVFFAVNGTVPTDAEVFKELYAQYLQDGRDDRMRVRLVAALLR